MAAKNKFMNAMKMPAIADMFSSEADRQRESGDLVTEVPLSELHPFVNHPFEVRDDEDMQKRWRFFLRTIKDATLAFSMVINEIQIFLEPVFDAIVNETEWQENWKPTDRWSNNHN
mgnify:CR=1 FL=1